MENEPTTTQSRKISWLSITSFGLSICALIALIYVLSTPMEEPVGRLYFMYISADTVDRLRWITLAVLGINIAILILVHYRQKALRFARLSIAGTVMTGLLLFVIPLPCTAIWADGTTCRSNMRILGWLMDTYSKEHHSHLPSPDKWIDEIDPYSVTFVIYHCPLGFDDSGRTPTYAMNSLLKGLKKDDIAMPDKTVLLFESIPGKNLSGGPELLPEKPRHKKGHPILFADGHVERIPESRLNTLNWWPKYKEKGYQQRSK